ncbi:unnamed protein product, partial [marine sediment metagenome]
MNKTQFTKRLEFSSLVKWRLFNKLREEFEKLDFLNYNKYKEGIHRMPDILIDEWDQIEKEFKNNSNFSSRSLRGFLFEALFHYACLRIEALFKDDYEEKKSRLNELYDIYSNILAIGVNRKLGLIEKKMTKMVLLITNKEDITTDFIVNELNDRGIGYYRFNTEDFPSKINLSLNFKNKIFKIIDFDHKRVIKIKDIISVYFRRPKISEIRRGFITQSFSLSRINSFASFISFV